MSASSQPLVFAITDRTLFSGLDAYWRQLEKVACSGVDGMVLREKDVAAGEYRQMARRFVALCDAAGCTPVLHSYPELCDELGTRWVHLPLPQMRELDAGVLGELEVGVSVHSAAEAQESLALFAAFGGKPAYLFVSNIFETDCKPGLEGKGLELLQIVREVAGDVPLIALGGITPDNVAQTFAAGADGVAFRSGFMGAEDPTALVRALRG